MARALVLVSAAMRVQVRKVLGREQELAALKALLIRWDLRLMEQLLEIVTGLMMVMVLERPKAKQLAVTLASETLTGLKTEKL